MSSRKLNEHVEDELFNIEKRVTVNTEEDKPVKKKKPYYRKKYNKPKPVEVTPEPVNKYLFIKGLLVGSVLTAIICHILYSI